MDSIGLAAGWISSIGGAIALVILAARQVIGWPVAYVWMENPRAGETSARLTVVNKGDQRIDVVSIGGFWPRGMVFDVADIGRMMMVVGSDTPWIPERRPPNYRTELPVGLSIEAGGKGLFDFAISGEITSTMPWARIKLRSARFIARTSWMPVKMLHAATPNMIQN
jgi:hypothetical protein